MTMSTNRKSRGKALAAAAFAAALAASPAAFAEEKAPDELAREGIGKIVSALEMLLLTIPTYEMPEVMPNGDIIIRRRNPLQPEDREATPEDGAEGEEEPKPI
jgi:hypothetical protein